MCFGEEDTLFRSVTFRSRHRRGQDRKDDWEDRRRRIEDRNKIPEASISRVLIARAFTRDLCVASYGRSGFSRTNLMPRRLFVVERKL